MLGLRRDAGPSATTFDAFVSYSHAADGGLAPAVRRGLQQLAKPWYRLRALTVFLDRSGLEVTPELWSTIVRALDASTYLVLLASPAAAASRWVNQEVEHWLAHRGPGRILPVLTAGEWEWDVAGGDLDRARSTAVPPALFGAFTEEPAYLDLRWAAGGADLDLRNNGFRDGIAQLAAPIHGRPKSELDGEDVRQYRRTRRVATGAVAALVVLLVAALVGGVIAVRNASVAGQQRNLALSRLLASQATERVSTDPRLAALLSVAARRFGDNDESRGGMLAVLETEKRVVGFVGGTGIGTGTFARAFSPDGRLLAVPDGEAVSVWDVGARRVVTRVPVASGALAFTDDGARLVLNGRRGVVLWDLASSTSTALSTEPALALAAGGGRVVATFSDGGVRLWDARTGQARGTFAGPPGVVDTVAVSPDGSSVAAGVDKLAVVWEAATGHERARSTALQARPGGTMAFDPSGGLLAMSAPDRSVAVWNWATGATQMLTGGHRAGVQTVAFAAPGVVVSAGTSGDVVRWNLTTGQPTEIPDPTSQVTGVSIGPGASVMASGGFDGSTAVWRPGDTLAEPAGDPGTSVLTTDPSGTRQATLTRAGAVTVRGAPGGDEAASAPCPATEAAFAPGDRQLALACPAGRVALLDLDRGQVARTLDASSALAVGSVAVAPDGAHVAAALADGTVVVWSAADGRETRRIRPQIPLNLDFDGQVVHVAFVDDTTLAYAVFGAVQLADVATGEAGAELPTPSRYPVTSLALSADRRLVAVGSQDGSVTLWDPAAAGQPVAILAGGPVRVSATAFSQDGRTLAVADRLGGVTLWDVAQRARRAALNSFSPVSAAPVDITGVGFSGGVLYTAGDGGLKRYDLDAQRSQDRLCRIAGRDLTDQEWRAYVGADQPRQKVC